MALPTANDVHVNTALSQFSLSHLQRPENYVATGVFPIVPVMHKSDSYFERSRADQLRDTVLPRAPGTPAVVSGVRVATGTYNCVVYSEADYLPDEIRANADPALRAAGDNGKVDELTQKMRTKMERIWAGAFFKTGVWNTDSADVTNWDLDAGDPIGDLYAGINAIRKATGLLPNCGACNYETFWQLQNHPDIVDRWKRTHMPGQPTNEFISGIFAPALSMGIKVGMGVYNSAPEGAAESMANLLGNGFLLTYSNPNPSVDCETAGTCFMWASVFPTSMGETMNVRRWYDLDRSSDKFQIDAGFDFKPVDPKLGYFIQGTI